MRLEVLAATWFILAVAHGYPSGAPDEVCTNGLTPGHGKKESGVSPYEVTASSRKYTAHAPITVRITSKSGEAFRGFVIQAQDRYGKPLNHGEWRSSKAKSIEKCGAATHTSNDDKQDVSLTWTPGEGSGTVTFVATIVKKKEVYYHNIKANVVGGGGGAPSPHRKRPNKDRSRPPPQHHRPAEHTDFSVPEFDSSEPQHTQFSEPQHSQFPDPHHSQFSSQQPRPDHFSGHQQRPNHFSDQHRPDQFSESQQQPSQFSGHSHLQVPENDPWANGGWDSSDQEVVHQLQPQPPRRKPNRFRPSKAHRRPKPPQIQQSHFEEDPFADHSEHFHQDSFASHSPSASSSTNDGRVFFPQHFGFNQHFQPDEAADDVKEFVISQPPQAFRPRPRSFVRQQGPTLTFRRQPRWN